MIGYLLSGNPDTAFTNIELAIASKLSVHRIIQDHPHKVSEHNRVTQSYPVSPVAFLCHHLLLEIETAP